LAAFTFALAAIRRLAASKLSGIAHEPAALKAGIPQTVIDVVKYGRDVSGLGEKEAAIIRFGRALFREKKMSSKVFAKTVSLFDRQGTAELTALMGDYQLNGLLLKVAGQHLPADRKALLPPRWRQRPCAPSRRAPVNLKRRTKVAVRLGRLGPGSDARNRAR
jgi:4-carboxymuconolactone decarboxylase